MKTESEHMFVIQTSAAEYVVRIGDYGVETTDRLPAATRMDEFRARSILRTVKARWDNGAGMIRVYTTGTGSL